MITQEELETGLANGLSVLYNIGEGVQFRLEEISRTLPVMDVTLAGGNHRRVDPILFNANVRATFRRHDDTIEVSLHPNLFYMLPLELSKRK